MNDFQNRLDKNTIEVGKSYPITIAHITAKGIIVNLEDGLTSFIHISKIANAFIEDINNFVAVGEQYNAIGIATDNGKELSLQHLNLKSRGHKPNDTESKKIPYNKPKAYKSLDDMINDANASFRDKHGNRSDNSNGKRRKPFKKPIYD